MSSERSAVVREFFALVTAGDFDRIPEHLDPDVVWYGTHGGLDSRRVVRGPEAFLDYLREVGEPWEQAEVAIERLIQVEDVVVAFLRETAQSRRGPLELRDETAALFKFRQQKIAEVRGYLDRDEALKAANLKA